MHCTRAGKGQATKATKEEKQNNTKRRSKIQDLTLASTERGCAIPKRTKKPKHFLIPKRIIVTISILV